ncbi:hypothetical protein FOCG_18534 [Fusarium oxysporum f. sp. radicis-lycopersici 26381]|nr:hypothetical protein FOCG_18534 [Fusarium oxysporum f. sp. radicis-lycopersici 26381]
MKLVPSFLLSTTPLCWNPLFNSAVTGISPPRRLISILALSIGLPQLQTPPPWISSRLSQPKGIPLDIRS